MSLASRMALEVKVKYVSPRPWTVEETGDRFWRVIDAEGFPVAERLPKNDALYICIAVNGLEST